MYHLGYLCIPRAESVVIRVCFSQEPRFLAPSYLLIHNILPKGKNDNTLLEVFYDKA